MTRALVLMLLLGACGVDGPPTAPVPTPPKPAPANGVSVHGDARVGVVATL